ncbi:MBL fold metallo-hydrolase [Sulfuracidifex tepidarius]|uniref:Ribonuclease J n=1 Tax=Sulfuracidifex tepidarius TaxID=1294262 RepID=A0A510DVC1_9CREN|nr:MBL fold metallo-hydrolase [Sulfuracidifex tepidarius]BBG24173.1 Ribonuclease J [Sulfuracidifex tepidarius]BBG26930.1 Ribonuclease J [Sulfuracidifex tepidarius]
MDYYLKILGGGREVGRSAIEIGNNDGSLVMDYGVNFDNNDNPNFPLQELPGKVKGFLVSHGHLDHVGALPIYQISTLKKRIYGTPMTKAISELILRDFVKLSGPKIPFEWVEVKKAVENFNTVEFDKEEEIEGYKVKFTNAGHIPGSAQIHILSEKFKITYTGDINTAETKLMNPANPEDLKDTDVLIMEATYGRFNHPSREVVEKEFLDKVKEVIEGGGTVLVPAFSLNRSQELLSLFASSNFPYPVYYDGMSREITEVMLNHKEYLHKPDLLKKAYDSFHYVNGFNERKKVWKDKGVIVASAGMLKGGPAVYYYKKLAEDPKNAVFLVSYQAPSTPGRKLLEIGKFDEFSPMLKARFELFDFSSHSGKGDLMKLVKSASHLQKLVIVHASSDSAEQFAATVKEEVGVDVVTPENGQEIKL